MNPDCIYRWPVENQSIAACFSGCYEYVFVTLPPFVRVTKGKTVTSLWDVAAIASWGQLLKWSEVARSASMERVSDVNKAMLYAYEFSHVKEYAEYHEALKRYCDENNVMWPGEARLDPYTASAVARGMHRHGFKNAVLDFHGISRLVAVNENTSPAEFPSMDKFHPMHMYTECRSLLLTSYHEFYYYLLASNEQSLLVDIVNREELEGFFAGQDDTSNWSVPNDKVLNSGPRCGAQKIHPHP